VDYKLVLEVAGIALGVGTAVGAGCWAIMRSITAQFTRLGAKQQEYFHVTDVRLARIETTVTPYAVELEEIRKQQLKNITEIAELRSMKDELLKHGRQIEFLQNSAMKKA